MHRLTNLTSCAPDYAGCSVSLFINFKKCFTAKSLTLKKVLRYAAKLIANRFCLTAFFGHELSLIRPHQAYKNDLQRLVRFIVSQHAAAGREEKNERKFSCIIASVSFFYINYNKYNLFRRRGQLKRLYRVDSLVLFRANKP